MAPRNLGQEASKFWDAVPQILGHSTLGFWGREASRFWDGRLKFWDGRRRNLGPERLSILGREALKFWDGRPWDFGMCQDFETRGVGILHLGASGFGDGARCLEIWDEAPRNLGRDASDFGTGPSNFGTGDVGFWGRGALGFWGCIASNFGTQHVGILGLGTLDFRDRTHRLILGWDVSEFWDGTCQILGHMVLEFWGWEMLEFWGWEALKFWDGAR